MNALLHGWGKVKARLDVAIDASDGEWKADLLLRRAKLNLRLGLPLAAAADAETADKYAKQATAKREAPAPLGPGGVCPVGAGGRPRAGASPRSMPRWLASRAWETASKSCTGEGVCESALALDPVLEEAKRQPCRVRALQYLRDAIKRGYKSTAAYGLVAHLMKNAQKRKDAIRWIEESLDKQWTEEGLIAVFGKVPDVKKVKEQLRNTYITQAAQHQWLGEWKESLDPAQKAVNVGGDYAWSYLVLAGAKLQIGDLRGCESALDKAVSLLPRLSDEVERKKGREKGERAAQGA